MKSILVSHVVFVTIEICVAFQNCKYFVTSKHTTCQTNLDFVTFRMWIPVKVYTPTAEVVTESNEMCIRSQIMNREGSVRTM
jgi:hypothetical protein